MLFSFSSTPATMKSFMFTIQPVLVSRSGFCLRYELTQSHGRGTLINTGCTKNVEPAKNSELPERRKFWWNIFFWFIGQAAILQRDHLENFVFISTLPFNADSLMTSEILNDPFEKVNKSWLNISHSRNNFKIFYYIDTLFK